MQMTVFELYEKIQERTDNARSGYVKSWKNHSIINTLTGLNEALRRQGEELDFLRILDLVRNSFTMEGVDEETIIAVSDILNVYFN